MKVGTDIVEISRIPADNLAFVHGVLSHEEIALLEKRKDKAQFIAGRYAAKEAFLKALGTGLAGAKLNDIDVSYRDDGSPILRYEGHDYEVSISHDGGYAISVVIIP
jgi:holo-[acyl-carrier protein] synthase